MNQITSNRNSKVLSSNFPSIQQPTPHNQFYRSYSSNFLDRNYTKVVKHQQHLKKLQSTIISKDSLNSIQRKLKNYYNEMLICTNHKQNDLDILHDEHKFLSFKLEQLIEFQDIELPDEKICVRNFEDFKSSKNKIEARLRALVKEKMELDEKFKNESEYSKTIEYLYENEQKNLEQIHVSIIDTEAKLTTINFAGRNINANILEKNKKTRNYSQILAQLTEDIEMIDTVLGRQMKKTIDLDTDLAAKEDIISKKKTHMIKEGEHRILMFNKAKEQTIEKIRNVNELIKEKFDKEKSYIKTILCLNLIQKHFIDVEEFNLQDLLESNEYKELMNDKIIIVEKNNNALFNSSHENEINFNQTSSISMHQTFRSNISKKDTTFKLRQSCNSMDQLKTPNNNPNHNSKNFKQLPLDLSLNINKGIVNLHFNSNPSNNNPMTISHPQTQTGGSKPLKIELSELQNRFKKIHITKENLYEYYSKICSKINFYRNQFIDCNKKQIQLEEKKDRFGKKVKEIITKDYKNFMNLIKNDSRFEELLKKNQNIIDIAKEKHAVNRFDKINNNYQSLENENNIIEDCSSSSNNQRNVNKNISPVNSIENSSCELYHTVQQIISNIRNLMDSVQSSLKTIPHDEERKRLLRITDKLNKQLSHLKQPLFEDYVLSLISVCETTPLLQATLNEIINDNNCIKSLKEFVEQEKTFGKKIHQKNLPVESIIYTSIKENTNIVKAIGTVLSFAKQHCTDHNLASGKKIGHTNTRAHRSKYLLKPKDEVRTGLDDSYSENDTALTDNKTVKKQNNSIDERIIRKLYDPTLAKTFYSRSLNDNMKVIKELTITHSKDNFALNKKKSEIDELSNNLLLYNNPKINVNALSNDTYNTIVSYIISHKAAFLKKGNVE